MQIGAIIRDDSRASSKADAHRPCSSNLLVTFSSIGVSRVQTCKSIRAKAVPSRSFTLICDPIDVPHDSLLCSALTVDLIANSLSHLLQVFFAAHFRPRIRY